MLTYKCPKTGDFVETTIETTEDVLRRLGQFKLSVWCPHCQEPHQIMGADAFVMAKLEGRQASCPHVIDMPISPMTD